MDKQPLPFRDDIEDDPIHLAAADWFVRLQSTEVSLEATLAWQAWIHESPLNAQAFARIEEISDVMRHVAASPVVSLRELARDRYDASVPLKDWKRPRMRRRSWLTLGAAASIAAVALAFAFLKTPATTTTFATAIGETSNVTLADGSIIALGGDTKIRVALTENLRAIELTRAYASQRTAFGKPVGTFQASRFAIAEMVTKTRAARSYVDQCILALNAGELTADEAAGVKYWTTDVLAEVADAAVQLHGGYGYMDEYEVSRIWRDARVTRIYGGTNEIMKEIVGRSLGF